MPSPALLTSTTAGLPDPLPRLTILGWAPPRCAYVFIVIHK